MKIISWNVNGIRSVYRNNFKEWLEKTDADIVCLQETKAQKEEIEELYPTNDLFQDSRYHLYLNSALKRGYSGVAVFTKKEPLTVRNTLGFSRFDQEGRILELEYPNFTLVNLYIPHGGRQKENLSYKLEAYTHLLDRFQNAKKNIILAGDFNIAHQEIDLARPKENEQNTMFTAEERAQLDRLCGFGFVDTFRKFHAEGEHYTWWPYSNGARERNLGWRIDYIFVAQPFSQTIKDAFILRSVIGSDHCPVGIELTS